MENLIERINGREAYAIIPNRILSVRDEENNFTSTGSYFDLTKDDKIIRVIYELLIGRNLRNVCKTTLEDLIISCGYKSNKESQAIFKLLLRSMNNNKIIELSNDNMKPKELVYIDVQNIVDKSKSEFTILTSKELDMIDCCSKDNREKMTLLKTYFFIKIMCHKREDKTMKGLMSLDFGESAQYCAISYDYITKFTKVTDVNKAIAKLAENGLIDYNNYLIYKTKKDKKKDSTNIYVVAELEGFDEELIAEELKVGMKQYKYALKEKGFTICRENSYKNNDKKLNGKKGKIVSMRNAGKDTTKLEKEIKIAENKVEEETKTVIHKKDRLGSRSPFNDDYNPFKSQDEFLKSINKDEYNIIDSLL